MQRLSNSLLTVLGCLGLWACASAPAEAPAPAETGPVGLRFDWSGGLTASVEATRTHSRRMGGAEQTFTSTLHYDFAAVEDGDQLRIVYDASELDLNADATGRSAGLKARFDQANDVMPSHTVTRSGGFVGLHGVEALERSLRAFIGPVLPSSADGPTLEGLVGDLTSTSFLETKATEQWNMLVGFWIDSELEIGRTYEYTSSEPFPVLPGQQVLMHYSFVATGTSTCNRSGEPRTCVQIELRSEIDGDDARRVIDATRDASASRTPPLRALDRSLTLTLVTEPDGLVPHAYTSRRSWGLVLEVGDGDREVGQAIETRSVFSYR